MQAKNIDALLATAASTGDANDYQRLFDALKGVELFLSIATAPDPAGGTRAPASTPLVKVGPSLNAVLLCISRESDKLSKPYGGVVWERALQMVASMPQADGLVIQGDGSAWVGLDKAKVNSLLATQK